MTVLAFPWESISCLLSIGGIPLSKNDVMFLKVIEFFIEVRNDDIQVFLYYIMHVVHII
jgi:hypothetical protein